MAQIKNLRFVLVFWPLTGFARKNTPNSATSKRAAYADLRKLIGRIANSCEIGCESTVIT